MNVFLRGSLVLLGGAALGILAGGAAALPFLTWLAFPGPPPLPSPGEVPAEWVGEVHRALVTAVWATAATAAASLGSLGSLPLLWRRGLLGALPALAWSLVLVVSGFAIRGLLIHDAWSRTAAIEQAVQDFGFPITESIWQGVDDVGTALVAIILTIFTFAIDLILQMMYMMFQLALYSPMLLVYTVAWVFLSFILVGAPSALLMRRRAA